MTHSRLFIFTFFGKIPCIEKLISFKNFLNWKKKICIEKLLSLKKLFPLKNYLHWKICFDQMKEKFKVI